MKTYHLFRDFGVYKATVKRNFEDNDRGPEDDDVRELLARRTQTYTLEEIENLSEFLITSHDECVTQNPDDYYPIQVRTAKQKIDFAQSVWDKIKKLKEEANAQDATAGGPAPVAG